MIHCAADLRIRQLGNFTSTILRKTRAALTAVTLIGVGVVLMLPRMVLLVLLILPFLSRIDLISPCPPGSPRYALCMSPGEGPACVARNQELPGEHGAAGWMHL